MFIVECIYKDMKRLEDVSVVVSNQSFPSPAATPLEEPDYIFCAMYSGIPPPSSAIRFACAGAPSVAQYVYVFLPFLKAMLGLCEVGVFVAGKYHANISTNSILTENIIPLVNLRMMKFNIMNLVVFFDNRL